MSTAETILAMCFTTPVVWVVADFAVWAIDRKLSGHRVWR
jgi:hypothetical protein